MGPAGADGGGGGVFVGRRRLGGAAVEGVVGAGVIVPKLPAGDRIADAELAVTAGGQIVGQEEGEGKQVMGARRCRPDERCAHFRPRSPAV